MNIEICDSINLEPGLAKDIVKAVKKRLLHKSSMVQFLTITLLETMFKNCGDFVHSLVVEKDIIPELVKIVRKKTDMEVRDKILVLLDSCQEAFGGAGGKFPQYFWACTDLKRSGVEFPHRSGDASLIFTPTNHHTATPYGSMPSNSLIRLEQAMASEMSNLSLSDLNRIREVAELLNEMLKAVNRHDDKAIKDEVITDLVDQCRSNQQKVLQLIDSTGDEKLLGQGLILNDNLQSLLAKHDAIISGSPPPFETSVAVQGPITLSPATAITNRFEEDNEEDDDEFSRLARRNSKIKPSFETTDPPASSNGINVMSPAMINTNEIVSSMRTNGLALPDPPQPTATKEQNIDILSITQSSNPSPSHIPLARTDFQPNTTPETVITNGWELPHNRQTYPVNKGRLPYSSYVASWAQPQLTSSSQPQPQMLHIRPEQQPQPQPIYMSQQQVPPSPQFPPFQQQQSHNPPPLVAQEPDYASYPPPPWEDGPSSNPFTQSTYRFPDHASTTLQQADSFGMNYASPPVETGAGASASSMPLFVPSYKLFEDPRNPHGGTTNDWN